ncbi:hypothetical protein CsSME_00032682 [Camellia sinensis var. sinensis]
MGSKIARERVLSAFEYLLEGRKVILNADQRKGFDPRIITNELLKRWSMTIIQKYTIPYRWPLKNLSLGAQAEKNDKEIVEIEENKGLNKYLKIISTMVNQITTIEYAYKTFRIFYILTKDPKAVFWTKNHHHPMGDISY